MTKNIQRYMTILTNSSLLGEKRSVLSITQGKERKLEGVFTSAGPRETAPQQERGGGVSHRSNKVVL